VVRGVFGAAARCGAAGAAAGRRVGGALDHRL